MPLGKFSGIEEKLSCQLPFFLVDPCLSLNRGFHCFAPFAACSLRLEFAQNGWRRSRVGRGFLLPLLLRLGFGFLSSPYNPYHNLVAFLGKKKKYFQSHRNKTHCLIWKETLHHVWVIMQAWDSKTNISGVKCDCDLRHHLKTSKNENLQESKMLT